MNWLKAFTILLGFIAVSSCNLWEPTPAPRLEVAGIGGRAFIDSNLNGEIDTADIPLEGAEFTVISNDGTVFWALTDANGQASVNVSYTGVEFPVRLRMKAPEGSQLEIADQAELRWSEDDLAHHGLGADFLFIKPETLSEPD